MDGRSIFREELAIRYPDHGHALWEPSPRGLYEAVQVGDVGFIDRGYFYSLFNALRPPPSNSDASDGPTYPPRLKIRNTNHICKDKDNHQDFCSHNVQKQLEEIHAVGPDNIPIRVECSGRQGAFLHLPFPADREETIARGDFGKWLLKHIDGCLKVAHDLGCDINRMEDIILVTGRHLARSWVSVAFPARRETAWVSFRARVSEPSGVHFVSLDENGGELKLGPTGEDLPENQCVFVQGYHVARILNFWPRLRAAGSVPDLHDPEPEPDMGLEGIGIPSEADGYPDPLHILLKYIAEQASNCDMILVHDNDLGFMDGALGSDTLMEQIRGHVPSIRHVQCDLRNESTSEAEADIATVATLSQDLFEAMNEDQDALPSPTISSHELFLDLDRRQDSFVDLFQSVSRSPVRYLSDDNDSLGDDSSLVLSSARLSPLPRTSERPPSPCSPAGRTYIHMLDYDSLLNMFDQYRLEDVDNWNLQFRWCKLSHVCRKWRYLIFDSSSFLNIHLLLTNGSLSIESLAHLSALPLAIHYCNQSATRVRRDEKRMLAGFQQPDRVRHVLFQAPSQSLRICVGTLNEPFPTLESLSLASTTEEEANLVLPGTFRAPNLRYVALQGIGLPMEFQLSSALKTVTLTRIPASCYLPPAHLITQLQGLDHLEEISIGFAVPVPLPSAERELLPAPIPQVTLPNLKQFMFWGVDVYLEKLVAQINTPLLERLMVTLFFQPTFTLVNLAQSIHTIEGLDPLSARVLFNDDGASLTTNNGESRDGGLTLSVNCGDRRALLDSATQVCGALEEVLSAVKELALELDEDGIPSNVELAPKRKLWLELLLPFRGVKKLHIGSALTSELSDALKPGTIGLDLGLLPELQDLEVQLDINRAHNAFSTFIKAREREGRRIRLLGLPVLQSNQTMSHKSPTIPSWSTKLQTISSWSTKLQPIPSLRTTIPTRYTSFDKSLFVRYMKDMGKAYRKQAIELIDICRILDQIQTPASDAELRSVLKFADGALISACNARTKTSKKTDEKFRLAIDRLCDYAQKYFTFEYSLRERLDRARRYDTSSSTIQGWLKEKFNPVEPLPTRTVEFLIHKSLLDHSPISVKQVLTEVSPMKEVLWNFSRFPDEKKRLGLEHRPRFYGRLPTFSSVYGAEFRMDPIQTFMLERICVLTASRIRIYLETSRYERTFVNVWLVNNVLIFQDVYGKLEGENVVGATIMNHSNLWCFKERLQAPTLTRSQYRDSPSPATTEIPSYKEAVQIQDWRKLILEMLQIQERGGDDAFNIRILVKPPGSPPLRSHSRSPVASNNDGSLLPIPLPAPQPSPLQSQFPAPSTGPSTPFSYVTAQNTPLRVSTRSPVVGQSPKMPMYPPSRAPSVSLPKRVSVATPPSPSPAVLPIPPPQQQSIAVSPQTERVTSIPQIAHPPSELSRELEYQGGSFLEAGPISLRVPIADVPSLSTVAIMSREVRSISGSHVEAFGDRIDGKQLPRAESYPEHADATSITPDPAGLPSPDEDVPAVVPQTQRQEWKRN